MVTGNAGADEGLRDGDHTHWACKQKARLFIPGRARRIRPRARCSRWAMPGARRATKQLLCAVRLRLRDQAGETGERRGVRRGAQGEAAIWQVQQADPERSTRTAELQAPRAGPADIRARRSRPPASAPADWRSRGPARPCRPGASPRSALSSPWPRPAVSPHLLRAEPGAGEARLGTRRQRGLRPCARAALGLVSCVPEAPRAASGSRTAPPGEWRPESRPSPSPEPVGRLRGQTSFPPGGVLAPRVPAAR